MSKNYVVSGGGKVDALVMALIKKANDEDKMVRETVFSSLAEIGRKQPNLHLSSVLDFLHKNPKLEQPHRIILLKSLQKVLQQHLNNILPDLAQQLIELGMQEMMGTKDLIPDWQNEACELLLILGTKHSKQIMEILISKFTPGKVPHYYVMKLIADLSTHSPAEVVPLLKDVIARTVSVTSSVKKDNLRWVFCYAISHFSEAIVHFIANAESPEVSMQFVSFGTELYPAYEIMLNVWLTCRESKVRLMAAKAIGNLCAILPRQTFDTQLPKLFPPILNLFKKEKDLLPVTQAVCNVLEVGVQSAKAAIAEAEADPHSLIPVLALEPMLPTVLSIIHPLCVKPFDETDPHAAKTNNELLRCHEVIGYAFPSSLISFLLERLDLTNPKSKDPNVRAGTLLIIRHLVDRIDPSLQGHKELLVIGMKGPCHDEANPKVQKLLSQVIISMSSKNYLELEGGEELVDFIVRINAIPDQFIAQAEAKEGKVPPGYPSLGELRSLCDDILNISATAVPCMDVVLWPFLFEFVVNPRYTHAMGILTKAIGALGARKRAAWEAGESDEDAKDFYLIDFDKHVNLPGPHALIARLMVMSSGAMRRNKQGENVLQCLRACGPILHPEVQSLWDNALTKLVMFINNKAASWGQQKWEDLILRLLAETIKIVGEDSWTMKVGESLADQLPSYADDPEYKANALKHLGLILQKLNHKEFIKAKLELMFSTTNHANEVEQLGCALGFGYCAATHLDIALEKIADTLKPKMVEKSGFFDSFFGPSSQGPSDPVVRTAMLAFGYVSAYAPPKLITSRLEVTVLAAMRPHLERKGLSLPICETMIKVIDLIAKSVHPSHLRVDNYQFKPRDELLRHVINYITTIPPGTKGGQGIRIIGLNAIAKLIVLEPPLSGELENELVSKTIQFFNMAGAEEESGEAPGPGQEVASAAATNQMLFQNLNETLGSIVFMNTSIECLLRLLKALDPFVKNVNPLIRERAISATYYLLEKFVELLSTGIAPNSDCFLHVGHCLASMAPRITDSNKSIRVPALQATQLFLFIDHLLKNGPIEKTGEESVQLEMPSNLLSLSEMVARVEGDVVSAHYGAVGEMSSIICECLSEEELCKLLMGLLAGLTDADGPASSGTCIVLNSIIKLRGDQFLPQVGALVSGMVAAMSKVTHEKTINGTLHSIRTLSRHHPLPVINALIETPLPHSPHVITSLQAISKDAELLEILLDHAFDTLNNSQSIETTSTGDVSSKESQNATCTLKYVFSVLPSSYLLDERFAGFFSTLILRFGTTANVGEKPRNDLIEAFVTFAKQIENEEMENILKSEGSLLSSTAYTNGVMKLVACFGKTYSDSILPVYNYILPYSKANFKGQRLMVTAMYAELVKWSDNEEILQNIVNALLISMNDDNLRLLSIIGLGNSASGPPELGSKFAPSVIDALMSCIEHPNEEIAMEAMNGLNTAFKVVDPSRVQPILINLVNRIRVHLEKKNPKIRASAFRLFGTLSRFGSGLSGKVFVDLMHSLLPSVILHLTDPDRNVVMACKETIRKLVPLLGNEDLNKVVQRRWFDGNIKLPFDSFSNDFAKRFVGIFSELTPNYVMCSIEFFQSDWPQLRASAALFAGDLLGYLPAHQRGTLNAGIVCTAFITLLTNQKEPHVRDAAAAAMKLMYDY